MSVSTLHAAIGRSGVAHAAVVLTDVSTVTCRLAGVPTLKLVNRGEHTQYAPPQVASGNTGSVTLHRGQKASFWIQELAPEGDPVSDESQAIITLDGIAGAIAVPLTNEIDTYQQIVVSQIAPGVVSRVPDAASRAPRCTLGDLTMHPRFLDVAMPGAYAVEIITNRSARPCSVGGIPKLSYLHERVRALPHSGSQITIEPGAHASFWVFTRACVIQGERCPPPSSASPIASGVYRMAPGFTGL